MIISAVMAFIGWFNYDGINNIGDAIWSAFYKTLKTFIFETGFDTLPVPVVLQIAVYLAPLSLAGVLVYTAFSKVQEQFTSLTFRLLRREHVIIVGPPNFCLDFLYGYLPKTSGPILFMLPPDSRQSVPERLLAYPIIFADPSHSISWKRCGVSNAESAIVSLPSADEMQVVRDYVEKLRKGIKRKFLLHFSLESLSQARFFSRSSLFSDNEYFYVEGFNLQHMAALQAIEEYAPHFTVPLEILTKEAPHLVIDGFNEYAKWFIVEAAQLYHYPSLRKIHISLICDEQEQVMRFLQQQPGIYETVELSVINRGEIFSKFNLASGTIFFENASDPYAIFVLPGDLWEIPDQLRRWRRYLSLCHDNEYYSTQLHLFLPTGLKDPMFYKEQLREYSRLDFYTHSIFEFINLKRFLDNRQLIDGIAEKIHSKYVQAHDAPHWLKLNDAEKEMNRRSARHLKIKLYFAGYELSDDMELPYLEIPEFSQSQIHMFAEVEHHRWVAEKFLDGYIPGSAAGGREVDEYLKKVLLIHKDIRPFNELNQIDISKDEETFADLQNILKAVLSFKRLVKIS